MARSQPPLPPLDGAPGPAPAAPPSELRGLRDRILERARAPRGHRAWTRPLAAALALSALLGGTGFAAVRAWPGLRAAFAPDPTLPSFPTATAPAPALARTPAPPLTPALTPTPLPALAPAPAPAPGRTRAAIDRLARANELRAQKRWSAAEALYLDVLESKAGVQWSSAAALAAGELRLYQLGRPRAALSLFRRVLALEPSGALAEQARHGIALAYRAQGDRVRERDALDVFVRAHPASPMRERAEARLLELRAAAARQKP